jgi:hypothetical protein
MVGDDIRRLTSCNKEKRREKDKLEKDKLEKDKLDVVGNLAHL